MVKLGKKISHCTKENPSILICVEVDGVLLVFVNVSCDIRHRIGETHVSIDIYKLCMYLSNLFENICRFERRSALVTSELHLSKIYSYICTFSAETKLGVLLSVLSCCIRLST